MGILNDGRKALLDGNGLKNTVTSIILKDQNSAPLGSAVSLTSTDWVYENQQLKLDKSFSIEFNSAQTISGAILQDGTTFLWQLDLATNIEIPSEGGFITFSPETQTIYVEAT